MAKKLMLKIITPERILLEEEVSEVYTKSAAGEIGILPDHVAYMTPVEIGVTKYKQDKEKKYVSTMGGLLQVADNVVTILSNNAELGEEIDVARARAAKERAETLLAAGKEVDVHRAEIALHRAIARITAASGKG